MVTVKSADEFLDWDCRPTIYIDHHAILHARHESITHGRLKLQRRDADRLDDVCAGRVVQVHHQHVSWCLQLPDVPPPDRAAGRRREELRVGLGDEPECLVRRVSLRVAGEKERRNESDGHYDLTAR